MRINKEPWLAASLSWVFPGAGHLYLGAYVAGAIVIAFVMLLHVVVIASLLSTRISSAGIVLLMVCDVVVLPICVTADALRDTRSRNTSDFEAERTSGRDPWLAVFLSTIVPGIGQFYLRKWIAGMFLLAGTASVLRTTVYPAAGARSSRLAASFRGYLLWPTSTSSGCIVPPSGDEVPYDWSSCSLRFMY